MRSIFRSALLLTAVAMPAEAQSAVERDCAVVVVERRADSTTGPWRSIRPSDVRRRLAAVRAQGRWSAMVDSIEAIYLGRELAGLSGTERETFAAHLDSLRAELRAGENDPAELARGRVNSSRFSLHADTSGNYVLFRGLRSAQLTLTDATPEGTRIGVCGTAMAARDVSAQFSQPAFTRLAASLGRRVARWDRFMDDGYSMLPHELLINGLVSRPELEPPRAQFVLAHPSVATMIVSPDLSSLRDAEREDVLALEVAGLLMYGPEFRWYGGASWIITFPTSGGIGSGIMAHVPKLGRAAFIFRPRDADGTRRNGLLFSVDLYDALSGVPERWKRAKAKIGAICVNAPSRCADDDR